MADIGSKEGVKELSRQNKKVRRDELSDIKEILGTEPGRRFIWRLLTRSKVYQTIWEPSAKIHYNAGMQDFGHFLMGEIVQADPDAYLKMIKESNTENNTENQEDLNNG